MIFHQTQSVKKASISNTSKAVPLQLNNTQSCSFFHKAHFCKTNATKLSLPHLDYFRTSSQI